MHIAAAATTSVSDYNENRTASKTLQKEQRYSGRNAGGVFLPTTSTKVKNLQALYTMGSSSCVAPEELKEIT